MYKPKFLSSLDKWEGLLPLVTHPHMVLVSSCSSGCLFNGGVLVFHCWVKDHSAPSVLKQQPLHHIHGSCGSEIWTVWSGDGLFLFHSVWVLSSGDLNFGSWNHLEVLLFTCHMLGLGYLGGCLGTLQICVQLPVFPCGLSLCLLWLGNLRIIRLATWQLSQPRARVLAEPGKSYLAFSDPSSEVIRVSFLALYYWLNVKPTNL